MMEWPESKLNLSSRFNLLRQPGHVTRERQGSSRSLQNANKAPFRRLFVHGY